LHDACDGTKASYPWIPAIMQNIQDDKVEAEHNTTSKDKKGEHIRENTRNNWDSTGENNQTASTTTPGDNEHSEKDFLTEEDIENFLANEKVAAEEGNNSNFESQLKPYLHQNFDSREQAQDYFNFYSNLAGFTSVIVASYRTISKKRNNEVTRFTMKCNRYGRAEPVVTREKVMPKDRQQSSQGQTVKMK
jgi:hypothetical protein